MRSLLLLAWIAVVFFGANYGYIPHDGITGLLALGGVIYAAESTWAQFRHRIKEDRRKEQDERKFIAKKAAFVGAMDALITATQYYGAIANKNLPTDGASIPELAALGPALIQLHFYCEENTIKTAIKVGKVFRDASLKILEIKSDSIRCRVQVQRFNSHLSVIQDAAKRNDESLRNLLIQSPQKVRLRAYRVFFSYH